MSTPAKIESVLDTQNDPVDTGDGACQCQQPEPTTDLNGYVSFDDPYSNDCCYGYGDFFAI